jgi:hypothetical protein
VLALGWASSALGAISPRLTVTTTNSGGANVIISGGITNSAEDPFAKIQIFVPSGFALKAPVGGTTVGTVRGRVLVKDVDAGAEQSFTGELVAIGTTDPAVAFENASCDNVPHAAAWMMRISMNDGQASIPIFVDKTTGTETRFGAYKLVVCLRSPDLPHTDPNRSQVGTKLNSMLLTLTGFTVPTRAGDYRWRSLWTPYAPGTATVNTAGTVEAQSIVRIPAATLTLAAQKQRVAAKGKLRSQVKLTGKLLVGGKAAGNYRVGFSHGGSKTKLVALGSAKTDAAGNFLISSRVTKPSYFQAGVTIPRQDLGPAGCQASFGAGIRCVFATIGGSRVLSPLILSRP